MKMSVNVFQICSVILLLTACVTLVSGSAIPMWEYLSRGEKMSHLYSMFAKQVSSYCKNMQEMPTNQCKRNLLMYGINKLQDMNDGHLDTMDPYQRNSHDILWDAMMDGHTKNGRKKAHIIDTTPTTNQQYSQNPIFDDKPSDDNENAKKSSEEASEALSNQQFEPEATNFYYNTLAPVELNTNYLSGPMVMRLQPDGTEIKNEGYKKYPQDDDLKDMTMGKDKMSLQQMYSHLRETENMDAIHKILQH